MLNARLLGGASFVALGLAVALAFTAVAPSELGATQWPDLRVPLSESPLPSLTDGLGFHECHEPLENLPWTQRCGLIEVDRPDGFGDKLSMWVSIVTPDEIRNPIPLVEVMGGPTLPGVSDGDEAVALFPGAFQDREVITFDARGTGATTGEVECPFPAITDTTLSIECFQLWEPKSYDLRLFSAESQARDLEALRSALAIDKWDVTGTSYGAEIVQRLRTLSPDSIRSATLVFPTSTEVTQPLSGQRNSSVAISNFFADCAAEAYCERLHTDAERRFRAVQAELLEEAWFFPDRRSVDDDWVEMTANFAALTLARLVNDWQRLDGVSEFLSALEDRSPRAYFDALDISEFDVDSGLAEGEVAWADQSDEERLEQFLHFARFEVQHYATYCADGLARSGAEWIPAEPWIDVTEEEPAVRPRTCEQLQIQPATDSANPTAKSPAAGKVPILIISGRLDNRAPTTEARRIAAALPHAQLVELPWYGHQGSDDPCPQFLQMQFWHDPAAPLDASCVEELTFENIYQPSDQCPPTPNQWVFALRCPNQFWDSTTFAP